MGLSVIVLDEAEDEIRALPMPEQIAMRRAIEKLKAVGKELGYPHSSAVREGQGVRELRPRQGSSAWRAFYRRWRSYLVVAAIGPEAMVAPRGFRQTVERAWERLLAFEEKCREQGLPDI